MAIRISEVELSRNPVRTGETLIISVTIKNHQYLEQYRHSDLKAYTHQQIREMGCYRASQHEALKKYHHNDLAKHTHIQIREKGDAW